jgi:hypothetical protein
MSGSAQNGGKQLHSGRHTIIQQYGLLRPMFPILWRLISGLKNTDRILNQVKLVYLKILKA